MTETIFVNHTPDTYKAYKTIGGWGITFLDRNGQSRQVDGGKVYPNRQNAYARVKSLNHPIEKALNKTGKCEAYWDGKEIVVREDENEDMDRVFNLSISNGAMPPYYSQDFKTVEEAEIEIRDNSHIPLYIDWKAVKDDE